MEVVKVIFLTFFFVEQSNFDVTTQSFSVSREFPVKCYAFSHILRQYDQNDDAE